MSPETSPPNGTEGHIPRALGSSGSAVRLARGGQPALPPPSVSPCNLPPLAGVLVGGSPSWGNEERRVRHLR